MTHNANVSMLNAAALAGQMPGMLAIAHLPWTVNRMLPPNTVIFSNRHGRIIGRGKLSDMPRIPLGTTRVVVSAH